MRRKLCASAPLALFLCAIIGFGTVAPLSAAPSKNQSAAVYLKAAAQTHWSTQALYVLAEENILEGHLKTANCGSAIACAGPILGIASLGEDPRSFAAEDLVAKLISFSQNNQLGDPTTLNDDIFGILALMAAGVPSTDATLSGSKTFLVQNQSSDGGFGWMVGGSDVDDSAVAVMALLEAGSSKSDAVIQNAVSYIKHAQNADGGFPYDPVSPWGTNSNANTTAWVVSMVHKLGEDPESLSWSKDGKNPVAFLNSLQTSDGWFEYEKGLGNALPVDTTAQVAIALAGASYPVRKITYTPSPPPPPPAGMIIPPSFMSAPLPPFDNEIKQEEPAPQKEEQTAPAVLGQKLVVPFPDGALLKTPNDPTVYMIENGRKRWIPNEIILGLRFPSPRVIEFVDPEALDEYPEGLEVGYPDSVYLIGKMSKQVHLIARGRKYHVRSGDAWARIRARADTTAVTVPDEEFIKYETGGVVE